MIHCQIDRFETWCTAAVDLLRQGVPPQSVRWEQVTPRQPFFGMAAAADRWSPGAGDHLADEPLWSAAPGITHLPKLLLERAEKAACHRDPAKWDLFYRLLWRSVHGEPHLLGDRSDPDVRRLAQLQRAVTLAVHRMEQDVCFYERLPGAGDYALAWHRPDHAILRLVAPFFMRKFLVGKWALFTPQESVEWDGRVLQFGPGVPGDMPPRPEELVARWRACRRQSFRPDRIVIRGQSDVAEELSCFQRHPSLVLVAAPDLNADGTRLAGSILAEALSDVGIDSEQVALLQLSGRPAGLADRRQQIAAELGRLQPRMLVSLGATAAQTLFGRGFRVSRQHGQVFASPWAPRTMATYHPAALVRVPDLTVRARMKEQFLYDLHRIAEELSHSACAAE